MKLSNKVIRMLEIFAIRGAEAGEDVMMLAHSIWVDYDWGFYDDHDDNELAIAALRMFETSVLGCKNTERAQMKAQAMLTIFDMEVPEDEIEFEFVLEAEEVVPYKVEKKTTKKNKKNKKKKK